MVAAPCRGGSVNPPRYFSSVPTALLVWSQGTTGSMTSRWFYQVPNQGEAIKIYSPSSQLFSRLTYIQHIAESEGRLVRLK